MGIEQLVDAYKGNPAPLDAKVKQAQKGQPPGSIPPDLEEAIALQKITELRNSAQGQQAIQAGGAQPSVVEKLRQMLAAEQRQQGQPPQMPQDMPQGMSPQQGMPQMAQGQPPMPQGQPPMPQGQPVMAARGGSIAHLMSNLGRHYAGGGIVAFSGEDGSDVKEEKELTPEEAREILYRIRQRTDMRPESMAVTDMDTTSIPGFVAGNRFQQEMDKAIGKREPMTPQQIEAKVKAVEPERAPSPPREPYKGPQQYTLQQQGADWEARRQRQREEDAKKPEDEMVKLVKEPFRAAGRGIAGLFKSLYGQRTPGEAPEQVGADQNLGEAIMQASRNREAAEDNRPVAIGNEAQRRLPSISGQGLPAAAAAMAASQGAPSGGGRVGGTGVAGGRSNQSVINDLVNQGLITLPTTNAAYKKISDVMNLDADAEERKAIEKFQKQVGSRDLSIYDRTAAELEARKNRLKNPEPGFDSLMEYLGAIAQGGGGRTWMEAGAKGAAGVTALRKERQAQQDALMDKILEIGGKKAEAEYAQKEKLYSIGQERYKDVFKNAFDAAKEANRSDDEARRIATEAVMKQKDIDSRERVASMPGSEERMFNRFAGDWMSKPENRGKTIADAYAAYRIAAAPSAAGKGIMTRDQASDNVMKKIAFDSPIRSDLMNEARDALKKAGIASPSATQITDYLIDKELGRANSTMVSAPSSGRVVDFNSLPK